MCILLFIDRALMPVPFSLVQQLSCRGLHYVTIGLALLEEDAIPVADHELFNELNACNLSYHVKLAFVSSCKQLAKQLCSKCVCTEWTVATDQFCQRTIMRYSTTSYVLHIVKHRQQLLQYKLFGQQLLGKHALRVCEAELLCH